jgi:hypothetical protein
MSEATAELEAEQTSRTRHASGAAKARLEELDPGDGNTEGNELSTSEVAELLELGLRQTQRLAPRIGARPVVGGALMWSRAPSPRRPRNADRRKVAMADDSEIERLLDGLDATSS